MRLLLPLVAAVVLTGCASTNSKDRKSPGRDVPVVLKNPSISEKMRFDRQLRAEQEVAGLTEVRGAVRR